MKILYICTHNRCRSIMSEAITNQLGNGRLQAFSAGSQPVDNVHPLSIKYLAEKGFSTIGLQSQAWHDFGGEKPDLIVTLCDSAATETCPQWFNNTIKVHWALSDPSKLQGSESELRDAFYAVMNTIEQRVKQLLTLDFNALSKTERLSALYTLT